MKKPAGGRGHKAKYESTHARIPEPIKPLVESLSDQYRAYVAEGDCLEFENKSLLPKVPAIYFVLEDEEIIYIGQAKNLLSRWRTHNLTKQFKELPGKITIAWLQCEDLNVLRPVETALIESIRPRFNTSIRGETSTSFQPKWKLGETVAIRIPAAVKEYLLKIARYLDNGEDYERQVILTALNRYIEAQQQESGANQHRKKGEPLNIEKSRDWKHFREFMNM